MRPGGVECACEGNLDVVPGIPNCEPLRSNNGATETAPSGGAGDGVVEAGSTAAKSARASALLLLVLPLLARSHSPALAGRIGVPGNAALASLNFVGSGDLSTTTSYIMASRGKRYDETGRYERIQREETEQNVTKWNQE